MSTTAISIVFAAQCSFQVLVGISAWRWYAAAKKAVRDATDGAVDADWLAMDPGPKAEQALRLIPGAPVGRMRPIDLPNAVGGQGSMLWRVADEAFGDGIESVMWLGTVSSLNPTALTAKTARVRRIFDPTRRDKDSAVGPDQYLVASSVPTVAARRFFIMITVGSLVMFVGALAIGLAQEGSAVAAFVGSFGLFGILANSLTFIIFRKQFLPSVLPPVYAVTSRHFIIIRPRSSLFPSLSSHPMYAEPLRYPLLHDVEFLLPDGELSQQEADQDLGTVIFDVVSPTRPRVTGQAFGIRGFDAVPNFTSVMGLVWFLMEQARVAKEGTHMCMAEGCRERFVQSVTLRQHVKLTHAETGPAYMCVQCGQDCKNKKALSSHVRLRHTGRRSVVTGLPTIASIARTSLRSSEGSESTSGSAIASTGGPASVVRRRVSERAATRRQRRNLSPRSQAAGSTDTDETDGSPVEAADGRGTLSGSVDTTDDESSTSRSFDDYGDTLRALRDDFTRFAAFPEARTLKEVEEAERAMRYYQRLFIDAPDESVGQRMYKLQPSSRRRETAGTLKRLVEVGASVEGYVRIGGDLGDNDDDGGGRKRRGGGHSPSRTYLVLRGDLLIEYPSEGARDAALRVAQVNYPGVVAAYARTCAENYANVETVDETKESSICLSVPLGAGRPTGHWHIGTESPSVALSWLRALARGGAQTVMPARVQVTAAELEEAAIAIGEAQEDVVADKSARDLLFETAAMQAKEAAGEGVSDGSRVGTGSRKQSANNEAAVPPLVAAVLGESSIAAVAKIRYGAWPMRELIMCYVQLRGESIGPLPVTKTDATVRLAGLDVDRVAELLARADQSSTRQLFSTAAELRVDGWREALTRDQLLVAIVTRWWATDERNLVVKRQAAVAKDEADAVASNTLRRKGSYAAQYLDDVESSSDEEVALPAPLLSVVRLVGWYAASSSESTRRTQRRRATRQYKAGREPVRELLLRGDLLFMYGSSGAAAAGDAPILSAQIDPSVTADLAAGDRRTVSLVLPRHSAVRGAGTYSILFDTTDEAEEWLAALSRMRATVTPERFAAPQEDQAAAGRALRALADDAPLSVCDELYARAKDEAAAAAAAAAILEEEEDDAAEGDEEKGAGKGMEKRNGTVVASGVDGRRSSVSSRKQSLRNGTLPRHLLSTSGSLRGSASTRGGPSRNATLRRGPQTPGSSVVPGVSATPVSDASTAFLATLPLRHLLRAADAAGLGERADAADGRRDLVALIHDESARQEAAIRAEFEELEWPALVEHCAALKLPGADRAADWEESMAELVRHRLALTTSEAEADPLVTPALARSQSWSRLRGKRLANSTG